MPKIPEYLPEEAAPQPQGRTSPVLEAVGQYGQGLEHLGRGVSEFAGTLDHRVAQMEAAEVQANAAELKETFFNRIHDETNKQTLDQNKIFEDYDDWVNKTSGELSTGRGQAEFERVSGRIKGFLIRQAAQGQAQIAGAQAVEQHNTAVNSLTSLTEKYPHSFADNMDQLEEMYSGHNEDPILGKNPAALLKLKQSDQVRLADAAVRGHMESDFNAVVKDMVASDGKVDPRLPIYNTAEGMLKSGFYDKYLNTDQRREIQKEIRSNFSAAQTEGQRILNAQESQKAIVTDQWEQGAVSKWANNQLSVKEVLGSPMDAKDKIRWVHMIREGQKEETKTDPTVMNSLTERILSPDNSPNHISDSSQISQYVGKGIAIPDYMRLRELMTHAGQGEVDRNNEKQLMDLAKAKLVSANPMLGIKDPDGQYQLMLFTSALQQAKKDAIEQKIPVSSILDPNSKSFFGNRINQYIPTPQEILNKQANQVRGDFVPPENVSAQPGVIPKAGTPEETIMMYKNGAARQIFKSKQKEAEAAGYRIK